MVVLNQPISIRHIPVSPELAELYIQETKERSRASNRNTYRGQYRQKHHPDYKRVAYLRLKVNVLQFKDRVRQTARRGALTAVFSKYEGYDVYADYEFTKPLYTENILKNNRRTKTKKDIKGQIEELERLEDIAKKNSYQVYD